MGEDSLGCAGAGAEAIETALAAASPCGRALPAAFRNVDGKGFVFFLGFQPVLAMCSAWRAKYALSRAEETESLRHSEVLEQGQGKRRLWGWGANLALYV